MKNIKLLILSIAAILPYAGRTQSMSLADPIVAAEKAALIAAVAVQAGFKINQKDLMKRLQNAEADFFKKRNIAANFKTSPTTIYTFFLLKETQAAIDSSNTEIKEIKKIPNVLRHGLAGYESDIAKEQEYLNDLKADHGGMTSFLTDFTSGGTGYNKAADLKIMIRALEIHARVKAKKNQIKNLRTLNRVLFKI